MDPCDSTDGCCRARSRRATVLVPRVIVEGFGLHTGAKVRVAIDSRPGEAITVQVGEFTARIDELSVASTDRATTVQAHGGKLHIGTVEHAFGALAGMGIEGGLSISVTGPEMPLLDGGAAAWCRAFASLGAAPSLNRRLRVTRNAVLCVGASTYDFAPGERVDIEVCVDFDDPRIARSAWWNGCVDDFRNRIAPARTFAFERDIAELAARGLARRVSPETVVVVTPGAILASGAPFSPDEPARHKLLDMLGDLYIHGGPPRGRVHAARPGHAANMRAFTLARQEGILDIG